MTTLSTTPTLSTAFAAAVEHVEDAAARVRETPAPRWGGDARSRLVFVGYLVASSVVWVVAPLAVLAVPALLAR